MKNVFLISTLFFHLALPAQNAWDLFPLNQKTWWRTGDTLRLYYNDSTEVSGDQRLHYFGSKYIEEAVGGCLFLMQNMGQDIIVPPIEYFYQWASKNGEWKAGSAVFYPESLPGDSWFFPVSNGNGYHQIQVTCTGLDSIDFFDRKVWAKKFRLMPFDVNGPVNNSLSGFEMALTEQFGLNRFIPFHELAAGKKGPVYEMAGCIKDGKSDGLAPDFEWFTRNYAPGNLYKWVERSEYYWAGESTTFWHLDSLTNVVHTDDEIQLTSYRQSTKVFRKKQNGITSTDSSAFIVPEYKRILKRKDFQPLFDATPGWYYPAMTDFFGNAVYVTNHFDSTGTLRIDGDFSYMLDFCELNHIIDANYSSSMDSRCGYLGYFHGYLTGWQGEYLTGCRQGNEIWGDITPPPTVGIFQHVPAFPLRLYPTLATNEIYIEDLPETHFSGDLQIEIRQAEGRTALQAVNYQPGRAVEVSGLPAGVYFVTVRSENALAAGKFVKM